MEDLIKYLIIFSSSTIKFIFGPTLGVASGVHWVITSLLTAGGMMMSVVLFTYYGDKIRTLWTRLTGSKKRRLFTKRNRRFVSIWKAYGVPGVAFFSPILLTPIGGAVLANAFGGKPSAIFKYMSISALFWGFVITYLVYFANDLIGVF